MDEKTELNKAMFSTLAIIVQIVKTAYAGLAIGLTVAIFMIVLAVTSAGDRAFFASLVMATVTGVPYMMLDFYSLAIKHHA